MVLNAALETILEPLLGVLVTPPNIFGEVTIDVEKITGIAFLEYS